MSDWVAGPGGTKTVSGQIGIRPRLDGQIGIRLGPGRGEISTVAADPQRERGNPHPYSKLRSTLVDRRPGNPAPTVVSVIPAPVPL